MIRQPYKAGGAITDDEQAVYIERQADYELRQCIQQMDYVLLIEPRQQGKTSLIHHAIRTFAGSSTVFVYVDVTTPDASSQDAWYRTLCRRIQRQLSRRLDAAAQVPIPASGEGWRDFLSDIALLARDAQQRIIIALDEIGAVDVPAATKFFSVLREIYNARQVEPEFRALTFILSGAFHPRDLIRDERVSPFNIAHRIRIRSFSFEQTMQLVQLGGWADERSLALARSVQEWAGGQPYLTQLICGLLPPDADGSDVVATAEQIRREDENHLPPMLERLHNDEALRRYMQRVLAGEQIHFLPAEHRRQATLELLGVLGCDPDGYCCIRNRICALSLSSITISDVPEPVGTAPPLAPNPRRLRAVTQPVAPPTPTLVTLSFHPGATPSITWDAAIFGQAVTPFTPPYSQITSGVVLKALDALQYEGHPYGGPFFSPSEQVTLSRLGLWQDDRVVAHAPQLVGQALYAALDLTGQNLIRAAQNESIAYDRPIHYRLHFPDHAGPIAALPWELLHDGRHFVLLHRGYSLDSCERHVDINIAHREVKGRQAPFHLLALVPRFGITDELRAAEAAIRASTWEPLRQEGVLTCETLSPVTPRGLSDYLLHTPRRPDIIHYMGHGLYGDQGGTLLLDNGSDGVAPMPVDRLSAGMGGPSLIVLHACQSATVDTAGSLFASLAPALSVAAGAVVAMQTTVRTRAALRFAEVLYEELLLSRRSLQDAVTCARQALFLEEPDGVSWFVPALYIRGRDPRPLTLFDS